ncbi:MAG: hypothetical protein M3P51_07305 [Chloroflexota bacterium]|nr:hypothetical protein [Chloroflexota bacterium]
MHNRTEDKLNLIMRVRMEADELARQLDVLEVERRAMEQRLVELDTRIHAAVIELGEKDPSFQSYSPPLTPEQVLDCAMHYRDAVLSDPRLSGQIPPPIQ